VNISGSVAETRGQRKSFQVRIKVKQGYSSDRTNMRPRGCAAYIAPGCFYPVLEFAVGHAPVR